MSELETFLKDLARNLKAARKKMGLSQIVAAHNMKIDYRHYQNIEGGKINLRMDTLMKLIQFYGLSQNGLAFDFNSFLKLLSDVHDHLNDHHQNWEALYKYFVEGGRAGFLVVRALDQNVLQANDKILSYLGLSQKADLENHSLTDFLASETSDKFRQNGSNLGVGQVSTPFLTTFKSLSVEPGVPMMTLMKAKYANSNNGMVLHVIFFDKQTLDEEGHRLSDIVSGYKQFLELYPQLKAV